MKFDKDNHVTMQIVVKIHLQRRHETLHLNSFYLFFTFWIWKIYKKKKNRNSLNALFTHSLQHDHYFNLKKKLNVFNLLQINLDENFLNQRLLQT